MILISSNWAATTAIKTLSKTSNRDFSVTLLNSAATTVIKTPLQIYMLEEQPTSSLPQSRRKKTAATNLARHYWKILNDLQRVDPSLKTRSAQVLVCLIINHSNVDLKPVLFAANDEILCREGRQYLGNIQNLYNSLAEAYTGSTGNNLTFKRDMTSDITAWELLLLVVIERETPESIGKKSCIIHFEKGFR